MSDMTKKPCYCGSGKKLQVCCMAAGKKPLAIPNHLPTPGAIADYVIAHGNVEHQFRAAEQFYQQQVSPMDVAKLCFSVLKQRPEHQHALYLLGIIMLTTGEYTLAEKLFLQLLALNPTHVGACGKLVALYTQTEHAPEAMDMCFRALGLLKDAKDRPQRVLFLVSLVHLMERKSPEKAEEYMREALEITPHDPKLKIRMASLLHAKGQWRESHRLVDEVINGGMPEAELFKLAALPQMLMSWDEIHEVRDTFTQGVERLKKLPPISAQHMSEFAMTTFYLSFHGLDNRSMLEAYSSMLRGLCPELNFVAPHCLPGAVRKPGRQRIGFLTRYFRYHSVGNCYSRIIESLADSGQYDIILLSEGGQTDAQAQRLVDKCKAHVRLGWELAESQDIVSRLELDALVYLDIGMVVMITSLAHARLAPLQVVLAGHPDTTGISTIDYFITNDVLEVEDAQELYSEQLVRCQRLTWEFERPTMPTITKTLADFGLPEDKHIYLCPMMLQKLHPDFDTRIARILERDPNGVVVLFQDNKYAHYELIQKRFEKTLPVLKERVIFSPFLPEEELKMLILQSHVVIDPPHFGGGTTAGIVFAMGTPYVTLPGMFFRSRAVYVCYKYMGISDGIAKDEDDFIELAVSIAQDPERREAIKQRILAHNHHLYGDVGFAAEFNTWFRQITGVEEVAA